MPASDIAARQRRLELARKAFKEFYAECFWSYREDAEITEEKIPFVIRGLREHGGLAGYRIVVELSDARVHPPQPRRREDAKREIAITPTDVGGCSGLRRTDCDSALRQLIDL